MKIPGQILDPNRRNPTSGFGDRVVKGFVDSKIPIFSGSSQPNGGNIVNKILDDPTYLGFSVFFDFVNSPLFFISDDNSLAGDYAYKYLSNVSPQRAEILKIFVNSLQYLQNNKPYVFQTIEGLDRCWNIATDLKDPYMGGDDAKISIGCLESLDLRITGLMDLYRKLAYDVNGRREILPANLRKFKCTIIVQEIRRFKTLTDIIRSQQSDTSSNFGQNSFVAPTIGGGLFSAATLNQIANGEQDDPISLYVNDNCSQVVFNLDFCEFMPEVSSAAFSGFNNAGEKTAAQQKIGFMYEKVSEVNRYSTLEGDFSNDNISRADGLGFGIRESALQAASRRVLAGLAGAVKSRVSDSLVNKAKQLGIRNPLGALNTISTLLSADGVVRFGESLLSNVINNTVNSLSKGSTDAFAGQRTQVNEKLNPDIKVFYKAEGPNEILTEKLDPLSSSVLSSAALQPTNFNGDVQPPLNQENLIERAPASLNFKSLNSLGVGNQPQKTTTENPLGRGADSQPFTRSDIIGSGPAETSLRTEKILPAAYRPTNNDGSNVPALTKIKILGGGGPPGPILTAENIF
jgi:hypothetical protein